MFLIGGEKIKTNNRKIGKRSERILMNYIVGGAK